MYIALPILHETAYMEWNTTQNKNNSRVNDRQGKCLNWINNREYYIKIN